MLNNTNNLKGGSWLGDFLMKAIKILLNVGLRFMLRIKLWIFILNNKNILKCGSYEMIFVNFNDKNQQVNILSYN